MVATAQASFQIQGGPLLSFLACKFDPVGALPDQIMEQNEELTDTGVDGKRWRELNSQFLPFRMITISDFSTYALAITERRRYFAANRGIITRLNVTLAATGYSYNQVKILDVQPRLIAAITANGFTGGGAAQLYCVWSLILTGF